MLRELLSVTVVGMLLQRLERLVSIATVKCAWRWGGGGGGGGEVMAGEKKVSDSGMCCHIVNRQIYSNSTEKRTYNKENGILKHFYNTNLATTVSY
jgi:hypothetical protein